MGRLYLVELELGYHNQTLAANSYLKVYFFGLSLIDCQNLEMYELLCCISNRGYG